MGGVGLVFGVKFTQGLVFAWATTSVVSLVLEAVVIEPLMIFSRALLYDVRKVFQYVCVCVATLHLGVYAHRFGCGVRTCCCRTGLQTAQSKAAKRQAGLGAAGDTPASKYAH